ncbi:MAG: prolipoprotein diacylglyceryl transferase [Anaerolineales bacterium]|nr:prolipoprotein diacylglyceryl transferase [Anaerolineales bacterium]
MTAYPLATTTFHPVFLYESLWNLAGFGLLMWIARKYAHKLWDGDLLSLYLIWYSTGRILIEFLRPDAWSIGAVATAQLVGASLILIGIALMIYRRRNPALATNPFTHPTPPPTRRHPA